jgi:hypothetical protein
MKQKLLAIVKAGQEREAELDALCFDAPADPRGRWAAKDHLAHLAWWRSRRARLIDAVRSGVGAPTPVETETQNANIYEENRDRSVAEIKQDARASWAALKSAIEACTEEDLAKPHPGAPDAELWETVPGDGGHLGTHLMFWYLDNQDEQRAEAAELWAYDLESSAFPDPAKRADATYNLACFYSRVGRADDSVRLLRESFRAKPDLIALARRDPDLDPLRRHPELDRLLAT